MHTRLEEIPPDGCLHFDMPSGVAGDMFLGASLDLGVPQQAIRDALALLPVQGFRLCVTRCTRAGKPGTDVTVAIDRNAARARSYVELMDVIQAAGLPPGVETRACDIMSRMSRAASALRGVPTGTVVLEPDDAVDALVDVVGAAAALAWLAPTRVTAGAVAIGRRAGPGGPSPIARWILEQAGAPVIDGGYDGELCTPTGAAIVTHAASAFGQAAMAAARLGFGAGDLDRPDRPNLFCLAWTPGTGA